MVAGPTKNAKVPIGAIPPPFKRSDVVAAIPKHCFERSVLYSTAYLIADLAIVGSMVYFLTYIWNPSMLPAPLSWIGWLVCAAIQGTFMTGLWVIAHECGHGAYSAHELLNDIIGFIVHTVLLVPYFSWKISHAKHHARTGSMEEDEVFVPQEMKARLPSDNPLLHTAPLRLLQIVFMLVVGWPAYLAINASSHKTKDFVSHYWPYCSLFSSRQKMLVFLSDLGLGVWGVVVYKMAMATSWHWIMLIYGIPMIFTNAWLVGITALHHTHHSVPHYSAKEWTWLRGALSTIDRDYGFLLNVILHHIGDTHVAHHLFHEIPHYHAQEATAAIKPVLGEHYLFADDNVFAALYQNTLECFAVEEDNGIYWWRPSPFAGKKASNKTK